MKNILVNYLLTKINGYVVSKNKLNSLNYNLQNYDILLIKKYKFYWNNEVFFFNLPCHYINIRIITMNITGYRNYDIKGLLIL